MALTNDKRYIQEHDSEYEWARALRNDISAVSSELYRRWNPTSSVRQSAFVWEQLELSEIISIAGGDAARVTDKEYVAIFGEIWSDILAKSYTGTFDDVPDYISEQEDPLQIIISMREYINVPLIISYMEQGIPLEDLLA